MTLAVIVVVLRRAFLDARMRTRSAFMLMQMLVLMLVLMRMHSRRVGRELKRGCTQLRRAHHGCRHRTANWKQRGKQHQQAKASESHEVAKVSIPRSVNLAIVGRSSEVAQIP